MQKILAVVLVLVSACVDEDAPKDPPTCESLGCPVAICNRLGECVCNGEACVQCERADAGVCIDQAP